ncbi:MAG: tyrosine-type recombinase/integrase [Candidatus Tyrphobacter sp.]
MGYLKQLGEKKWRIVYDVTAPDCRKRRQKTETLFPLTKAQAKLVLAKREEAVAIGKFVVDDITVSTLFERFIQAKTVAQRAPKTIERYGTLYAIYIGPRFGDMTLGNLKQHHLTDAYAKWLVAGKSGRALSARSVRHIHDLTRAMLNYAIRKGLVHQNVAALVSEDLPQARKPDSVALSEEQLKTLLVCAQTPTDWARTHGVVSAQSWFAPAVWFAAYTGARRGETLALRWSDLDFDQRTAVVRHSLTETKAGGVQFKEPKNGKHRTIVLSQSLIEVLVAHRSAQEDDRRIFKSSYRDDDLVFAAPDGSPVLPWSFTASFRYLVERAGVPYIRLHDLRDTHASLLGKHGVPLEVVSKRLGHATIGITAERYLHVYKERDAEAAAVFEQLAS